MDNPPIWFDDFPMETSTVFLGGGFPSCPAWHALTSRNWLPFTCVITGAASSTRRWRRMVVSWPSTSTVCLPKSLSRWPRWWPQMDPDGRKGVLDQGRSVRCSCYPMLSHVISWFFSLLSSHSISYHMVLQDGKPLKWNNTELQGSALSFMPRGFSCWRTSQLNSTFYPRGFVHIWS